MTWKCFGCGIMCLFFLCLLVILPIVGLVFWAILKTPEQFLLTSIAISVLWMGLGIGFCFIKYGIGKCRQLSK